MSSSIIDDVKKLYTILADDHGKLDDVKATMKHLRDHHGVQDKKFIGSIFHVLALEKMVEVLMETYGDV